MLGIKNYVIVIVVNALASDKKPTDFFDKAATTYNAATNSIKASMDKPHSKNNIQKQAYSADVVKNVKAAYGITSTNFGTHSPYINGKEVSIESSVINGTEVTLIKNGLNVGEALKTASVHKIIPSRVNRTFPRRLL